MLRARDRAIWDKAIELDAVVISKDADFVTLRALPSNRSAHSLDSVGKRQPGGAARSN